MIPSFCDTFPSPKIQTLIESNDYIVDMTSFVLDDEETIKFTKIYSKTFYKFNAIVVSRDSFITAYSFLGPSKIETKSFLYEIKKAHDLRTLCIKLYKPSLTEQQKIKSNQPLCFITGGLDTYIKIWDAFNGNLLEKIEISDGSFIADFMLFQFGKDSLEIDETSIIRKDKESNNVITNLVIAVGPPKHMHVVQLNDSSIYKIETKDKFSINTIEPIGSFHKKRNQRKKYILFAVADKGNFLKVWKIIKKRNDCLKYDCVRMIDLPIYWVLGLTSFKNSSDPYKSKLPYDR